MSNKVEARMTFFRPTGTVEVEMFDSVSEAKAWMRRRKRQLDREGFDTSSDCVKCEASLPRDGRTPEKARAAS